MDEIDETIPIRYNRESELEINVQPGVNPRDFKLNSRAPVTSS
jgi:hypothetical protein